MKTTITIENENKANEVVTLSELRELICARRKRALTPTLKAFKTQITPHTTDAKNLQVAAHYKSFQIRQFNLQKAVEIFNAGGSQKAIINN
jgi:hypothetical protein